LKNCKKMFPDLDQMCPKTSKGYVLSQPWLISKTSSCVLSPSHLLLITNYYPNWIFIFLLFLFAFANPNLQVIARFYIWKGMNTIQGNACWNIDLIGQPHYSNVVWNIGFVESCQWMREKKWHIIVWEAFESCKLSIY